MSTLASTIQETVEKVQIRTSRLEFIDFARGIVMAIMAWDHVSGFWNELHHGGEGILGRAPPFADTLWFLLRFVSHYCAPSFIFLAGTVLALSAAKRLSRGESEANMTVHMIKRGLVLLFLEAAFVSPAFTLPWTYFGVIACIGVSLIIFSVARKLPTKIILALSLIIVLNHSFLSLDFIPTRPNWGWYLRTILHEPNFERWPYFALYPIIPWVGVMGIGWSFGNYLSGKDLNEVKKLKVPIAISGVISIVTFFIVRWLNGYGNLLARRGSSLVDWLYVSKYPPSVAFLLWSLGGMCLFLALGLHLQDKEWFHKGVTGAILVFGRNPLFFYLTHLWLYRARWPDFAPGVGAPPFFLELGETLLFWVVGLVVLWQLCLRYEKLKRKYPKPILQYI
ncbi:MAG: heparan-alpha-glucosaminide N-acetyltransferase domain-containing protein [Candidatus Bathyarchaeota archaeon]|nr:heparan-alpha-glucosaminide N-acetyltransferase domain-containing protein [Candidatus Bathyarchaeota archaeon]